MSKPYAPPTVTTLGSVEEMTEQSCTPNNPCNKVGHSADQFTAQTGGVIVGSMVTPAP